MQYAILVYRTKKPSQLSPKIHDITFTVKHHSLVVGYYDDRTNDPVHNKLANVF